MKTLITAGELAKRWGVTIPAITALTEQRKLRAVIDGGAGSHRKYSLAYIEKVEIAGGFEAANSYDVLSVKRLEVEKTRLEEENKQLKAAIDSFVALAIQKRQEVNL